MGSRKQGAGSRKGKVRRRNQGEGSGSGRQGVEGGNREVGSEKREARSRKLEAESRKQETGRRKREANYIDCLKIDKTNSIRRVLSPIFCTQIENVISIVHQHSSRLLKWHFLKYLSCPWDLKKNNSFDIEDTLDLSNSATADVLINETDSKVHEFLLIGLLLNKRGHYYSIIKDRDSGKWNVFMMNISLPLSCKR